MAECEIPRFIPDRKEMEEVLRSHRSIAVVGASRKRERDSYWVVRYLTEAGYRVFPVNPNVQEIDGIRCYPSLRDIPEPVEIVDIFRKPEAVPEIVEEAAEIGAKVIWMQEGVISNRAAEMAIERGMKVIMNRCIKKIHMALFRDGA